MPEPPPSKSPADPSPAPPPGQTPDETGRGWAYAAVLAAALLFSTGGAAIKAADLSGWQIASFRSGVAGLAIWLLLPAARTWGATAAARRKTLLVALAYAGTVTAFVLANRLTTAANTIFLQSTAPLYILLLSPWLLRERVGRSELLTMVVVGVGLGTLLLGAPPASATAPNPARGNLLALLSGLTYALLIIGLRRTGRDGGSATSAVVLGNTLAFLGALPFALPLGQPALVDWLVVVYLGVFQVGLAYVLLAAALRKVPAFEASLLMFTETALNPVWTFLVHGEDPGPWAIAGGTLIVGALGAHGYYKRNPKRVP